MVSWVKGHHAIELARRNEGAWLQVCVWTAFGLLVARFAALWCNALAGTSLPLPGRIGFTIVFAGFSLMHAASLIGWRRAVAWLVACAAVSWSFEEVGIVTGFVYGQYHYGDQLGLKLGAVPLIIPFAWFMMIYASWVVARLLLEGAGDPVGWPATLGGVIVASFVMTAWDTVMDPGMARAGVWTWEQGGDYFGVPPQNFAGWLTTTAAVYLAAELILRFLPDRTPGRVSRAYCGLPVLVYGLMAFDRLLLPDLPELRIVAAFGMVFIALLAVLRWVLPLRA